MEEAVGPQDGAKPGDENSESSPGAGDRGGVAEDAVGGESPEGSMAGSLPRRDDNAEDVTGPQQPEALPVGEERREGAAAENQADGEEESDPLIRDIEAVLFIAPDPVSLETLAEVTGVDGDELALAVEEVRDRHSSADTGIIFTEVAGGYTFRAADASREAVERFCSRPIDYSLSPAAMETLAIVAHLQPITRPEIARIRGIGADTVVNTLLDKGLLMEAGRIRQGGAIQYRTTAAFEKIFGLGSLADLPPLEGFEATAEDVEELRQKLYLAAEGRQ